jgi:hypothetical protein
MRETREKQVEAVRPKRTPLGSRNLLTVENQEPGFHYAWVSDSDVIPGGVQKFLDAGYTFVLDPKLAVGDQSANNTMTGIGSAVSRNGGRGVTLYLMRILQEYYDEDAAAMEAQIKQQELDMRRPGEGGYGKLKIEQK